MDLNELKDEMLMEEAIASAELAGAEVIEEEK